MQLNYKITGNGQPVMLIHGLFGNLDNLGLLARHLAEQHQVIAIDLPNHGLSPRTDSMDYRVMADDVLSLLAHLALPAIPLVGHSMGGKVAMKVAQLAPQQISKLVVADIAPVAYDPRHQAVFAGLNALKLDGLKSRSEADSILAEHVEEPGVRQFLLKALYRTEQGFAFRYDVEAIQRCYGQIIDWPHNGERYEGPTLFVKGQQSDYILAEHRQAIVDQFPASQAKIIQGTGHWLHAEKPRLFNKIVTEFLA